MRIALSATKPPNYRSIPVEVPEQAYPDTFCKKMSSYRKLLGDAPQYRKGVMCNAMLAAADAANYAVFVEVMNFPRLNTAELMVIAELVKKGMSMVASLYAGNKKDNAEYCLRDGQEDQQEHQANLRLEIAKSVVVDLLGSAALWGSDILARRSAPLALIGGCLSSYPALHACNKSGLNEGVWLPAKLLKLDAPAQRQQQAILKFTTTSIETALNDVVNSVTFFAVHMGLVNEIFGDSSLTWVVVGTLVVILMVKLALARWVI